jgi:hypothetical protein
MNNASRINTFLYLGFTLLGIYFLASNQIEQAPIYLGIALAFDPFDQTVTWKKRPLWQKAVLILHLAFTAGILGYVIGFMDR